MDTLKYYESLVSGGEKPDIAKAHVYALSESLDNLVTKHDLHKEIDHLERKIEAKLDAKFATLKTLGWALFVGMLVPSVKLLWG
jgi:hypothetical protein